MYNLFFGKISKKVDLNQIEEGYYQAPKASGWFGNIQIGDYVYLIGGDKIQFWRAKEWQDVEGNDRLYFDILNNDLALSVNELTALKFLKLTKPLIVLTSRSARNKAFFKLELLNHPPIEELAKNIFYKSADLYRKIQIIKDDNFTNSTEDIQLKNTENGLVLNNAPFFDSSVSTLFRDNLKYEGQGSKYKDNTLRIVRGGMDRNSTFHYKQIGLRSFYDAFFCDYKQQEVDEYDEEPQYWLFAPGENARKWEDFVENKIIALGWDDLEDLTNYKNKSEIVDALKLAYGDDKNRTNDANANFEFVKKMQSGDIIIAKKGQYSLLGYGKVISDYFLDEKRTDYMHCREVDWTTIGEWPVQEQMVRKTLTNISNQLLNDRSNKFYHEYLLKIMATSENKQVAGETDLLKYKKQIILQGPPGTGKTRKAKKIAADLLGQVQNEFDRDNWDSITEIIFQRQEAFSNEQIRILNVTKNTVEINGSPILKIGAGEIEKAYKTEEFKKDEPIVATDRSHIANYLAKSIYNYVHSSEEIIKSQVKLVQFHPSYTYEDFVRGIVSKQSEDKKSIVFEAENKILATLADKAKKDLDNNYVLIIDEINRANLSSVLGELIYALEYRGEEVESMYAVGETGNNLVLPPNLYIIGTMNTADRSVGHIDYAIRRRFAFVDVLPKDLSEDKSIKFHSQLFKEVSALFIKNFDAYSIDNTISLEKAETLSAEFRPEDVWLGHSYFIQKRTEGGTLMPEDFSIRLEYEIKPILLEYVKDGILIDSAGAEKIEKRIKDLKVLD